MATIRSAPPLGRHPDHPQEIEFWADGPNRLHDRFRWTRPDNGQSDGGTDWTVKRLSP